MTKKEYAEQKKEEIRTKMDETLKAMMSADKIAGFIGSHTIYKMPNTVPAARWSRLNQMTLWTIGKRGTMDARGFRQWQAVGRNVKKGSKAGRILVPVFKKEKNEETGEDEQVLAFFKPVPVFALEDTEGDDLDYFPLLAEMERANNERLGQIPLINVALDLNVSVSYEMTPGSYLGYYRHGGDVKEIKLCTDSEAVFYHELAHAIDHKVNPREFHGPQDDREVVAEFVSCFLANIYGTTIDMNESKKYINHFSGNSHPLEAVARLMDRAINVVDFIMDIDPATTEKIFA